MIVTITIPDDLYQAYAGMNPSNPRQAIQKQLERFKDVPSNERVVLLSGEVRKAIEGLFGHPIEQGEELVKWLQELTALKLGEVEVPLKEGQRKRLTTEAGFYHREPNEYIASRVARAVDNEIGGY